MFPICKRLIRRDIHQNIKVIQRYTTFMKECQCRPHFSSYGNGMKEGGFPNEADVVIVGGGAVGSSIAYFLKKRDTSNLKVVVLERDPTYMNASTVLSNGGVRQQFSLPENILMSKFGSEFLQNVKENLTVENESPPDVNFQRLGYLFLATSESAETLLNNHKVQRDCGVDIQLFSKKQLEEKFPWINTDGIELGASGGSSEGWFSPWCLLCALKTKAISLGVKYVRGEASAFKLKHDASPNSSEDRKIQSVEVSLPNSDQVVPISCKTVVNAAGYNAGHITKLVTNELDDDTNVTPLPVEPRKRFVFSFHCVDGPPPNCPHLVDPSGVYFIPRTQKGMYMGGISPKSKEEEPSIEDLEVDYNWFEEKVWPKLAHRFPAFEALKMKCGWAGYYDFNTLDQNAIIGTHPIFSNLYFANGFSGHGIQQSTATGRAISELILDGTFKTIDLSRFSFNRIVENKPLFEKNIV